MSVCIIPARGGSRRIPNKNIRDFHGKPIIAYSIATAQASGLFSRIIVSTDSEAIGAVAVKYGAEARMRSAVHLTSDGVGTQEVTAYALVQAGISYGYACCIYATAPLMSADDLRRGLAELESADAHSGHCDAFSFAFSVGTEPLRDAGQFYWGRVKAFLGRVPLISPESLMIPIPDNRVCDINTESDWQRAEQMYAALHQGE